jgi:hypothetical protein
MLFKFGAFWKTVLILVGTWAFYGFAGFEMTALTLLALMFSRMLEENHFVI